MKRADRLLEQSKLFYENFADSLVHWYVVFKGQIEGWGANSPVQYISFFCEDYYIQFFESVSNVYWNDIFGGHIFRKIYESKIQNFLQVF